jgi:hypothetical protein
MVSLTPTLRTQKEVKFYTWAVYENVVVDQNDTITCPEFTDDVNLSKATLINNSSGAEITTTILLNVITVTGAATDADCTLFVYGRSA